MQETLTRRQMRSTQKLESGLATSPKLPPLDREALARGYRTSALYARLTNEPARHDAAERLCAPASRKPRWLHEARSKGKTLPDDRLNAAIMEGIAERYITPETLADYFGELFTLYSAQMTANADAAYLDAAREKAEACEAMAVARMVPTPENRERAVRELAEDVIVSLAHAKQLQRTA